MKNAIVSRIEEYFVKKRYNAASFAKEIGIGKQTVYDWLKGRTDPQLEHFNIMFKTFKDLDPNWVFTGETKNKEDNGSSQLAADSQTTYNKRCKNCERLELDKNGLYDTIRRLQADLEKYEKYVPKEKRNAS